MNIFDFFQKLFFNEKPRKSITELLEGTRKEDWKSSKSNQSSLGKIEPPKHPQPFAGGLIIENKCSCGNYSPRSTFGLINSNCKNCGGKQPSIVFR